MDNIHGTPNIIQYPTVELDLKRKIRLESGESLYFVVENISATQPFNMLGWSRSLIRE